MKTAVVYILAAIAFFIISFILIALQGCMSYPVPKAPEACACSFGPCQMPPAEKDGFVLMACKVEGQHSISCLYFGIMEDRRCALIVHTDDCVNYEVADAQCELLPQSTPKGETIRL